MKDEDVVAYLRDEVTAFDVGGAAERLPEGNLNEVWRVPGTWTEALGDPDVLDGLDTSDSVIVKHAPPYVAASPDVPLDPSRLDVEARCLEVLGPNGALGGVSRPDVTGPSVRPPQALHVNPERHVLVMEDVGTVPTLGAWLRSADATAAQAASVGRGVGGFLGRLHAQTDGDATYAEAFDNRAMQETRHAIQYQAVGDLLSEAGVNDAERLGARAEALGEDLLQPGRCLTMGDAWLRSVLVRPDGLRVIDWELAHFGRPLQDVAHWTAHLWMHAHRAPSDDVRARVEALGEAFVAAYRDATPETIQDDAFGEDAAVHVGAEILVRTVGRFQDGFLYDGLDVTSEPVQEAVDVAAQSLGGILDLGFWILD